MRVLSGSMSGLRDNFEDIVWADILVKEHVKDK